MAGKVLLIDGNSLLYRAFHALPPLVTTQGEMTGAVYGFAVMLYKVLEEEQPDYVAAAFDLPAPTFRHQAYDGYKATRQRAPEELRQQIGLCRELLAALRIPTFQLAGYEADDLLGTLAKRAEAAGHQVLIVSGDLDVLQLVDEQVSALVPRRGISDAVRYDPAAVLERYGLPPSHLIDLKALRGDVTDNIPGVPGIGEKTAVALLQQYGTLEAMLANPAEVKPARAAAALATFAEQAQMSKHLGSIHLDVPVEIDLEEMRLRAPDPVKLAQLFARLEFRGLLKKLPGSTAALPTPAEELEPHIIGTVAEAQAVAAELAGAINLSLAVVTEPGSPHSAKLLGLALFADAGAPIYVPGQRELLAEFKGLLEDEKILKSGHSLKEVIIHLARLGIKLAGIDFDSEIASYLASPLRKSYDLWEVAFDLLATPIPEPFNVAAVPINTLAERGALKAVRARELQAPLEESLAQQELEHLFVEVEMPTVDALAQMELAGVSIDTPYLEKLAEHLESEISRAEKAIFILAGEEFTINSPKQLQTILFEKLGLRRGKRTKTGYSTDAGTLAKLAEEYEIVALILEYRELTKLKSTYVDALPQLVNPRTGRIHPSFNQTVTATGRLSCSEPNLQNIPIRTELGKEIRRAFVASRPDYKLLAADYSQIELRVLAEIAQDQALCEIFAQDRDLHTATACEVFGVAPDQVTSEMRRLAKIINFSIPYGTSPESLAQRMDIPTDQARRYMAKFFHRFAGVARYMRDVVRQARSTGYVTTSLGRRRPLPEITSPAFARRELAERMAINTPIQGTAADIMKLAMLGVERALREARLETRLVLQVHDELVFEGPEAELAQVAALARAQMEGAYRLCVPLKVGVEAGDNWRDMAPM